jgi:hypothetical protein
MKVLEKKILSAKLAVLALGFAALAVSAKTAATLGDMPLYFEADSPARFVARGSDSQFLISPAVSQIILRKSASETAAVGMRFIGANPFAQISGDGALRGKINYLTGDDPAQWRSGVPTFAKVRVEEIYSGINLVYYGNQRQLEYDFTIAPGSDPNAIVIRFDGADKISINAQGELVLKSGGGEIRQPVPVVYQTVDGARKEIEGGYKILDAHTVAFAVGKYNHALPLVIDPTFAFGTYFGGTSGETAWAVALNPTDNSIYIAGQTFSQKAFTNGPPFSTEDAYQENFAGGKLTGDGFVARFDNTGTNLVFLTYLGGKEDEYISSVAVDAESNVFMTGFTDSTNFPTKNALYPKIAGMLNKAVKVFPGDAFVAELDPSGSNLVYSTYLGGSGLDSGTGIAIDSSDNAYVIGFTSSTNFPAVNPLAFHLIGSTNLTLNRLAGTENAFITEIASNGASLLFSTYFGGKKIDIGEGIAVGSDGSIYVAGFTDSTNFPTTNAISSFLNGSTNKIKITTPAYDAFAAKFEPFAGSLHLDYSTFLGGTNNDYAYRIACDGDGNAYITGATASPNFPDTNTIHQTTGTNIIVGLKSYVATNNLLLFLDTDAYLTKLGSNGAIIYSVIFGGNTNDIGYGVAVDSEQNVYVCGATSAKNFTTNSIPEFLGSTNYLRGTNSGGSDAFVIAFTNDCSSLLYSTYLGGKGNDYAYNIAVDPATGNAFVVGQTASTNFPTLNAGQPFRNGTNDAFLVEIQP